MRKYMTEAKAKKKQGKRNDYISRLEGDNARMREWARIDMYQARLDELKEKAIEIDELEATVFKLESEIEYLNQQYLDE